MAGVLLMLVTSDPTSADGNGVVIGVVSDKQQAVVAHNRMTAYLQRAGCNATVRIGSRVEDAALVFYPGEAPADQRSVLLAANRKSEMPRSVWVSRRTAGVRSLSELEGRDLAVVSGPDPVGSDQALAALADAGVTPAREQLYQTGDYSSALGLVLHNNTHAAASESGFVEPMLAPNDLVVNWTGDRTQTGGWFRGESWDLSAVVCEDALAAMTRSDDRQIFAIFPEWVHGFIRPEGLKAEEGSK